MGFKKEVILLFGWLLRLGEREVSVSDGVTGYNYQYDLAGRISYTDNAASVDMPQVQKI